MRPCGVVVAATITRFAWFLDCFVQGYYREPEFGPLVDRALTGEHRPPGGRWFTAAYFHHPDELPAEVGEAGLVLDRVVAVESPLWMIAGVEALLDDPVQRAAALDRLRRLECEPSLLGASSHLLTIARRPAR